MRLIRCCMAPSLADALRGRLEAIGPIGASALIGCRGVSDNVVTRELGFRAPRGRLAALRGELQQVCVELGVGCDIEERRGLLRARLLVLVRGTERDVAALAEYARVKGWETWAPR